MPQPLSTTPSALPVDPADRRRLLTRSPRPVSEPPVESKLKTACEEMESLFIHHMLSEMRKTVAKSGLLDGGRAEEIYTSLMDVELAKTMAASGGLGMGRMLQEQMSASAAFAKKSSGR